MAKYHPERKIVYLVKLTFVPDPETPLPTEDSLASALEHSTALDALSTALNCTITAEIPTPEQLRAECCD